MRNHTKTWLICTVLTSALAGCVFDDAPTPATADAGKTDAGTIGDSAGGTDAGSTDATVVDVATGGCKSNADCGKSQLCAKPFGQCGGQGECKPLPGTCAPQPPNGGQVCGCDGVNYADSCTAAYAGVNVLHTGACSSAGTCTYTSKATDNPCGPDQFCAAKCGTSGTCTARPKVCPASPTPVGGGVCGCDGMTYSDACTAHKAGVDVVSEQPCGITAGCEIGKPGVCGTGHVCIGAAGQCSGQGTCELTNAACTKEYAPVCGCNGTTYSNTCMAHIAGVTVAKSGACGVDSGCAVGDATACAKGQYCTAGEGQCSGKGLCAPEPQACTEQYDPVCGCDGKTYGNACSAAAMGVNWASKGECKPAPTACNPLGMGPMSCGEGKFCATPAGQCSATGECKDKPQVCPDDYSPTCGCDGKTYGNSCEANGQGVNVASAGECKVAELKWYLSCGGPVCMGYQPQPGVALCTSEKEGAACTSEGQTCDPKNECGQMLVCAKSDPKAMGCPKSRAALKTNIRYLEGQDTQALADRLMATRLATYKYKAAGPTAPTHLGFIIDNDPSSPAVDSQRDMVDLYGYLSMSVATLQTQQRQIQELRAEVQALKASCTPAPTALLCK
jgi:hypothetical protein